jgi:hypothetical protein
MKLNGILAGAAFALAACGGGEEVAVAPTALTVSDVEVISDLNAVGSTDAARYWGNLEADLESAVATQFVGQTSPTGARLVVDVDELSVASFFESAAGATDAQLTGTVAVLDPVTGEQTGFYTVSASANQAMTLMSAEPGTRVQTVPATSAEFYSAVVQAFARGVQQAVSGGVAPAA